MFAGNVYDCDCGLLWMNRLSAETINEQVIRELSDAACLMNDTANGAGGNAATGQPMTFGIAVDSYDRAQKTGTQEAVAVEETEPADGGDASFDESKLIKVSSLKEETCPGKERPLVDGVSDAAQNSDRILRQDKSGGAVVRPSAPLLLSLPLPLSAHVLLAVLRSRR